MKINARQARENKHATGRVIRTMRERPSRLPLRQPFAFFAAMLVPLLDAGEVRVGAVTARQVLLVEGGVFADQIAVCLVDAGK